MGTKPNRTGILTFHTAHNFGAMLQAYALEKAVNGLGFPCVILDYRFPPVNYGGIESWKDAMCRYGRLHGTSVSLKRAMKGYFKRQKPADRKFNSFMRRHMRLSKQSYYSEEALSRAEFDTVLFGSDQIWNPALTGGVAKAYFGGCFDPEKTRLVSYAASCGKDHFPQEALAEILPMLSRFSALGIREDGLTRRMNTEYGLPAQTVLDPVFLLTAEQWDHLLRHTPDTVGQPYLFVYTFGAGDEIYKLAEEIARQRKLRLVAVCDRDLPEDTGVLQRRDCGPLEFLRLVRNADFVCTTSFHGEAFAALFGRNFYCIGHPQYAQRNSDLLKLLGLENRMVATAAEVTRIQNCAFEDAHRRLRELRDMSLEFLKNNL